MVTLWSNLQLTDLLLWCYFHSRLKDTPIKLSSIIKLFVVSKINLRYNILLVSSGITSYLPGITKDTYINIWPSASTVYSCFTNMMNVWIFPQAIKFCVLTWIKLELKCQLTWYFCETHWPSPRGLPCDLISHGFLVTK